ncbi:MAG: glycine betaine ABC transporter substrate-binding protein, partial [Solirubrobacterales bacterium]
MGTRRMTMLLAVALSALTLGAAGCGDDDDGGGEAPSGEGQASGIDLSGQQFTVGSKEFTEQLILGEITLQVLEDAGAEVKDQIGLEGSTAARNALTSGEIDMYWEYTGTAWTNYLNNEDPIPDEQEQYEAVKEEDAQNDIAWLEPTPFNDTFAIAVRSDTGEAALDEVETISDLAELAGSNPELATFCLGEEFSTRPDGFPGMTKAYGFEVPSENTSVVGDSVVYQQTADGSKCNFGSVFSTDGRIQSLDLRVLEDDENFFPFFNAALNVRQQVLDQNEQLPELFNPIAETLDDETITGLNAQVDVDGERPEDVVSSFLEENGFTSG